MPKLAETVLVTLVGGALLGLPVWLHTSKSARHYLGQCNLRPLVQTFATTMPFGLAALVYLAAAEVPSQRLADAMLGVGTTLVVMGVSLMTWRPKWLLPRWARHWAEERQRGGGSEQN